MTLLIEHTDVAPVTIEVTHKRLPELPTIKRSDLIWAAEETLRLVNMDVPEALAGYVMEVAQTAEYISPAWHSSDKRCGCLIGTARMNQGYFPIPGDEISTDHDQEWMALPGSALSAELAIGSTFLTALSMLSKKHRLTTMNDGGGEKYEVVD